MHRKNIFLKTALVLSLVLFISSFSLAAKKDKEGDDLKIKGKAYIQWQDDLEEDQHSFGVTRAYLQFLKKLDDTFSVKITADAINNLPSDDSAGNTSKSNTYEFYLKNAYLNAKKKITDDLKCSFSLGMIGTPNIGVVDSLSDYRWVYNNYLDKSKNILGTSLDTSADLGASLNFNIMKMVSLTGALTNGEGYKQASEESNGKSIYGTVSINPFKLGEDKKGDGLFINGYLKRTNGFVEDGDNLLSYYGGGVAWKSKLIKVGANIYAGEKKSSDQKFSLFDSYLHSNLDCVIKMPVLVMGRFAFGKDKDNSDSKVTKMGIGAGYKFCKSVRSLLYYEKTQYETIKSNDMLYLKTEVKY